MKLFKKTLTLLCYFVYQIIKYNENQFYRNNFSINIFYEKSIHMELYTLYTERCVVTYNIFVNLQNHKLDSLLYPQT